MKCDLCTWTEKPERIKSVETHINDAHRAVHGLCVVWKDGQMTCTDNPEDYPQIEVKLPTSEIPEPPPVVVYRRTSPDVTVSSYRRTENDYDYNSEAEMG